MTEPGVRFVEMTDAEFDDYLERVVVEYSREGARATGMEPGAALEKGRRQIEELLPDGRRTEGHLVRKMVSGSGEVVGRIWFADRSGEEQPHVFIYDIAVAESARGGGVGTDAMLCLEEEARALGARAIRLHVFAQNRGARKLYDRLGYEVVRAGTGGALMAKSL